MPDQPPCARLDTLESYAPAWRRRSEREAEVAARWRSSVRERLPLVVEALVQEFGVTRVILFESLAIDRAVPGSDVDLLVDGLAGEQIIDATVVTERILRDVSVDLVPSALAHPPVLERALEEGIVLYG